MKKSALRFLFLCLLAIMASFLLQALMLLPSTSNASPLAKRSYPNPGPCSGYCSGDVHDPSVVYNAASKTYYRFCTNNKITISTATSMNGPWTSQGPALPDGSSIKLPGNQDLWAPDVFDFDGTFYMTYAVSTSGSQNSGIGVATSTSMDSGSWTDHGNIGIPQNSAYNLIDPNMFQHSSSSPLYLSFGSFWTDIYQVELKTPPLGVASSPVHLEQNTTAPLPGGGQGACEGSYQFQWGNYYYLFFSSGICCNTPPNLPPAGEEYKIMVCRSDSPTGGFYDRDGRNCLTQNGGTPVLESHNNVYAPGGQGVFFDPNQNSPVIYYHYVNPSISYDYDQFQFGWNLLDFSSEWPVVTS